MRDPQLQFAANLRRLREARGWSQERAAHESGLNPSHVAKIERGEREPGVRTIAKLSKGLGVSASELFEGIESSDAR
jgi:transcriptional regulator with XRE-family HTH domain